MWKYDRNESACNAGNPGSIPGSGRSPGEGNGNPLQYSCLGNLMDIGTRSPCNPTLTYIYIPKKSENICPYKNVHEC